MNNIDEKLNHIRRLLKAGRTAAARNELKILKDTADERDLWRVHELFGELFFCTADAEGAAAAYLNAAKHDRYLSAQCQHFSNYLFALHYLHGVDKADLFREHCFYGGFFDGAAVLPTAKKTCAKKIRVGYLAVNFLFQAAALFFDVMLTRYNRDEFEVYCYSLEEAEDNFSRRMKNSTDKFVFLPADYEEAAKKINADGIDILFDLGGHSAGPPRQSLHHGHRLF